MTRYAKRSNDPRSSRGMMAQHKELNHATAVTMAWSGARGTSCPKCSGSVCSTTGEQFVCELCGFRWDVKPVQTVQTVQTVRAPTSSGPFCDDCAMAGIYHCIDVDPGGMTARCFICLTTYGKDTAGRWRNTTQPKLVPNTVSLPAAAKGPLDPASPAVQYTKCTTPNCSQHRIGFLPGQGACCGICGAQYTIDGTRI